MQIEFLSGFFSGFIAVGICYPLDLCKTRIAALHGTINA